MRTTQNFEEIYKDHIIKMKDEEKKYVELLKTSQGLRLLCDSKELLFAGIRRKYIQPLDFLNSLKEKSLLDIAMNSNSATHPVEYLIQNNYISFKNIFDAITKFLELYTLIENLPLFQKSLESNELNRSHVKRFNRIVKKLEDKLLDRKITSFFDYAIAFYEFANRIPNAEEARKYLKIIEMLQIEQAVFCFAQLKKSQRISLKNLIYENSLVIPHRFSILQQVMESNLENTYNYEDLLKLVLKDDKKKKNKLNF